jgi:DNA polymerase-3 subunit chi
MSDTNGQPTAQTEVLFYHLERQPLERVLPGLLERTLARGWRAVVQSGSEERLEALDTALWTYSEASFLPHGTTRDGHAADQPVYLTTGDETPNGAGVRFLVDGASAAGYEGFARLVYLFDGRDEEAKARARREWQAAKSLGIPVTYWRQGDSGRWEKVGT